MKKEIGKGSSGVESVKITPPNFKFLTFKIKGTAPLVINKFSAKAREQITKTQEAGSQAKKGKKREPKDFEAAYQGARHISREGWDGIAAASFRRAMIDACRFTGEKMTMTKGAVFIEADGFDAEDGQPLVRIFGKPHRVDHYVRTEMGGIDIHSRPMWNEWTVILKIKIDNDVFSIQDATNLLMRAGIQIGVGEGRPGSKKSAGMGWGTFEIEAQK